MHSQCSAEVLCRVVLSGRAEVTLFEPSALQPFMSHTRADQRLPLLYCQVLPDGSEWHYSLSRYYLIRVALQCVNCQLMDKRSTVVCQGGWKLDWQMTSQLLCSSSYCRAASVECGTHTTYVSLQSTYQRITDTVNAAIPSLTMHKEMNSSRSAGEMCMLTCAVCVMCVLPVLCVLCVCFYGWFCVCMCAKRSTGACLW